MDNRDIEKKIQSAFSKTVPNVLDSVLQQCSEQGGSVITMAENNKKTRKIYTIAAIAAVFAIFISGSLIALNHSAGNKVATTVFLDVNPSVEMLLNRKDRVLDVKALNADGEKIMGDMDLKKTDLDVAVNALIGSMLKNGYLSDIANSILISVDNDDPQKATQLQQRLVDSINDLIGGESFHGSILSQNLVHDDAIAKLADTYDISLSKAQLISDMVEKNPLLTAEELSQLSINEINILRDSGQVSSDKLNVTGNPSTNGYIGEQKAWSTAVKDAANKAESEELKNAIEKLTTVGKIGMDIENGKMVYEIEFTVSGLEYEYEIDAVTGDVVSWDREKQDNSSNTVSGGAQNGSANQQNGNSSANSTDSAQVQPTQGNASNSGSQSVNYIGEQKAKEIALNHAGIAAEKASKLEIELDRENGTVNYDVSFEANGYEYDYEIDAVSGAILHADKERDETYRVDNTAVNTPAAQPTQGNASSGGSQSIGYIGEQKAKEIALNHAGIAAEKALKLEIELDRENGVVRYDVSFEANGYEYDYEINAVSGSILCADKERDDAYRGDNTAVNTPPAQPTQGSVSSGGSQSANYIGEQKAKEIALNHAGIAAEKASKLEIELDRENGTVNYDVSFEANGYEYDYEINAVSGAIIQNERDIAD